MLRIELDMADAERLLALRGREVATKVDGAGGLIAEVRGISVLGFGSLTARARIGPLQCGADGMCTAQAEVLDVAGITIGRSLVAKKLLGLLRAKEIPDLTVDVERNRLAFDTAACLARRAPQLVGYRVIEAEFADRSGSAALRLTLAAR